MSALQILGGRVLDPATGLDAVTDVFTQAGRIVALGQPPAGFVADQTLDAQGRWVLPGLVDLSARLREPGFEYMATLESELAAAAAGGVTSLAVPPDTEPVLDEPGLVTMLKHKGWRVNRARIYPVGALTRGLQGKQITEMVELRDSGCVAFSQAEAPLTDTQVLLRALQYAATFDLPVWLRPQDYWLARDGVVHDGEAASRMGLVAIPVCAETIALNTLLALAQETGAAVHLCRLSSAVGLDMVRQAKKKGLRISCDVAIHHVHLCDNDLGDFDSRYHLVPPLRSQRDRDAIRQALQDGTVDVIVSDHTPVDDDAKLVPFAESEAGATGLELLLPMTLKWAAERHVPLLHALSRITLAPAELLGLPQGRICPGAPADLVIYQPEAEWVVGADTLLSQGKNTPFEGMRVQGQVETTIFNGRVVHMRDRG
jgi:dihydroorotase